MGVGERAGSPEGGILPWGQDPRRERESVKAGHAPPEAGGRGRDPARRHVDESRRREGGGGGGPPALRARTSESRIRPKGRRAVVGPSTGLGGVTAGAVIRRRQGRSRPVDTSVLSAGACCRSRSSRKDQSVFWSCVGSRRAGRGADRTDRHARIGTAALCALSAVGCRRRRAVGSAAPPRGSQGRGPTRRLSARRP